MRASDSQSVECSVQDADRLPGDLRREGAVCGPLGRAVASAALEAKLPPEAVNVHVTVLAPHLISARLTVDGTALPEQKLGSSNRPLNTRSIDMLAGALAGQVAEFGASR